MLRTQRYQDLSYSEPMFSNTIANSSRLITFYQGETIPQKPEYVWSIARGVVKTLTWNEEGKISILGYWGAGDVIGLHLSTVNPYEVQCLKAVEARMIPVEKGEYLYREISNCLRQTEELLRIVRTEKMYNRLWQLLTWLGSKFGSQVLQGTLIDIRLTHQELADIMGSTRVTVTRLLNQLEEEKKIIRPCRFAIVLKSLRDEL